VRAEVLEDADDRRTAKTGGRCEQQLSSMRMQPLGQRAAGGGDGVGARRCESAKPRAEEGEAPKAVRMTWMQRLRRVFAIEIETCQRCGGTLEVISSIEDPELIGRILAHRAQRGEDDVRSTPFAPRAPPQRPL
jgi:hypothetical protein